LYTAAKKRDIAFERLLTWCSTNTALHAGLADRKGGLAVGKDADLAVWEAEAEFKVCELMMMQGRALTEPFAKVTEESLNFKNKMSAYVGLSLEGQVVQTYVRGELVFDRETGFRSQASGAFV
jgi:allantoinase